MLKKEGLRQVGQAQTGAVAKEVNPRNDKDTISPVAPEIKEVTMFRSMRYALIRWYRAYTRLSPEMRQLADDPFQNI